MLGRSLTDTGREGHHTYFVDGDNNSGGKGTPHSIKKQVEQDSACIQNKKSHEGCMAEGKLDRLSIS